MTSIICTVNETTGVGVLKPNPNSWGVQNFSVLLNVYKQLFQPILSKSRVNLTKFISVSKGYF